MYLTEMTVFMIGIVTVGLCCSFLLLFFWSLLSV